MTDKPTPLCERTNRAVVDALPPPNTKDQGEAMGTVLSILPAKGYYSDGTGFWVVGGGHAQDCVP